MKAYIRCVIEAPIIPERVSLRHDCLTEGGDLSPVGGPTDTDAAGALPVMPFPRPPRAAVSITCRGCFNRCDLRPGETGACSVKRNIAGRITRASLRVKGIVWRR